MAAVACPTCGAGTEPDALICSSCLANLTRPTVPQAVRPSPSPHHAPATPPATEPAACQHCGATPSPSDIVCGACLLPLGQDESAQPAAPDRTAATTGGHTTLALSFATGEVTVAAGTTLLLGRDPAVSSAAATLAGFDNVSRRHASVGVEADGTAWVRDEHSSNGTFVNGNPAPPRDRAPLADGDELRLAATVTARVRLRAGNPAARTP